MSRRALGAQDSRLPVARATYPATPELRLATPVGLISHAFVDEAGWPATPRPSDPIYLSKTAAAPTAGIWPATPHRGLPVSTKRLEVRFLKKGELGGSLEAYKIPEA